MEVYILDSLLRREQVVDTFESLIWTERWQEIGDFEIQMASTLASRSQFIPGTRLAMNDSKRVMVVETVEDATDEDGQATLTVKGRSLESILEDRVVKYTLDSTANGQDKVTMSGTPRAVATYMFYSYMLGGPLHQSDRYPFLELGEEYTGNIPDPWPILTFTQDIGTVYDWVKMLCDTYDMGFRIQRKADDSRLYFDIYTGDDRTSSQTVLKPVIFAPNMDNLQNTTELISIEGTKNVAYVFSPTNYIIVYGNGGVEDYMGFDRKVVLVKGENPPTVNNVPPTDQAIMEHLDRLGKEELAKLRGHSEFDGEMNQHSEFKYGVDYNLGDRVEMRNNDGVITLRRVAEQIFVSDAEGERSYPTLSSATFTGTDAWLYQGEKKWSEKRDDEYWATQ